MATETPYTAHISVGCERTARAAVNIVRFMNNNPDSGLERQLQGDDTIAMIESLAAAMADNPIASILLCDPNAVTNITEQASTVIALREIAQELQAQVRHSETVISRLRSEIEIQAQTIQRQAQAADLWHVAADGINEMLAGTPELDLPGPLVDRLRSLVQRYKDQESARDYVRSIP